MKRLSVFAVAAVLAISIGCQNPNYVEKRFKVLELEGTSSPINGTDSWGLSYVPPVDKGSDCIVVEWYEFVNRPDNIPNLSKSCLVSNHGFRVRVKLIVLGNIPTRGTSFLAEAIEIKVLKDLQCKICRGENN